MRPGKNLILGIPMLLVVFAISAVGLYVGAEAVDTTKPAVSEEEDAGGVPGGPVTVTIVAKNSLFERRTVTASPGVPVTVTFDNQDAGVLHNIAFYTSRAATTLIAGTEARPGPFVEQLSFTAPSSPGSYFFRCDVHPDTMTGTFAVR